MKALNEPNLNNDYKIESVKLSTNGHRELYFDVKWSGKETRLL